MIVYTGSHFGMWVIWLSWVLWWIDVVLSLSTCMLVTYYMVSRSEHPSLEQMSSLFLLPVVSASACSLTASIIIPFLPTRDAYTTLLTAYALWGFGVCMATMILTVYLQRLIFHHLPSNDMTVSIWLPLGFLGQGMFSIIRLGENAGPLLKAKAEIEKDYFPFATGGPYLYFIGSLVGLLMWGFAMWWLLIALISTIDNIIGGVRFSLGWWTFTFPFGSLANGTIVLGEAYSAPFFFYFGEIMAWCVVFLYAVCVVFTIQGLRKGNLLTAPCLDARLQNKVRLNSQEATESENI